MGTQQVHLAGHAARLQDVHVRLREDPGRLDLVPRLPVHRRQPAPSSWSARRRPGRRWASTGWTPSRAAPGCRRSSPAHLDGQPLIDHRAEVGGTGWLNFRRITNRALGPRQRGADGRRRAHHPLRHRLGHQAGDAGRDGAGRGAVDRRRPRRGAGARTSTAARRRWRRCSGRRRPAANGSSGCRSTPDLPATQFSYALSNRRGEYPAWRYLLHVATQSAAPRTLLRWALSVRRWSRARRRMAHTELTAQVSRTVPIPRIRSRTAKG